VRPHRAIGRRTPQQAYTARPKATPATPIVNVHYRVRRDRIDTSGVITIRYDSKLRHIGLGREHHGKRVVALIADRYIRVVDDNTGQLLRELTLDPNKDYQPLGRPPGPRRSQPTTAPAAGVKAGRRPPKGQRPRPRRGRRHTPQRRGRNATMSRDTCQRCLGTSQARPRQDSNLRRTV
jgi:hypothetical protein